MDDGIRKLGPEKRNAPAGLNWPKPGTVLCRFCDLADPAAVGLRIDTATGTFAGIVVRVGNEIAGFVDSCPHQAIPLSTPGQRYLTPKGGYLFCSGHGAMFRRLDGACVAGPCLGKHLAAWAVEVIDGQVVAA